MAECEYCKQENMMQIARKNINDDWFICEDCNRLKAEIERLEAENFAQSDLIEKLQAEIEQVKKWLDFFGIEIRSGNTAQFTRARMEKFRKAQADKEFAELQAENEKLKSVVGESGGLF